MKRILLLSVLSLACSALALFFLYKATHPKKSSVLPVLNSVPAFNMTAQDNSPVTLADLKGKISIVDFIFTTCQGPCPMMTATLSGLQSKIPPAKNIHFYSFTVDPETDTPEVLTEYGKKYNADFHRWSFLNGNRDSLQSIIRHGFRLAVENPDSGEIIHSTKFVLIDRTGTIRGYYDSNETSAVDRLATDALELEAE